MKKEFRTIIHSDIKITEFQENHISQEYIKWLNDKEVVRYSEQRHHEHNYESCYEYFIKNKSCNCYFLAIEVLEGQQWKHIGNLGAQVDQKNKIADLSIIIGDKNNWNKGFGTISWSMASLSLINLLNLRFVTAGTMRINKPMLSIFRKSGMQIEATLPNRFLFDGDEVDLIIASGDRKTFDNFLSSNDR